MDSTTKGLIKGYLQKADKKLAVARRLLGSADYDDAVSRAYYAAFHAARALLLSAGQAPSTHHGTVTLFNMLFVKGGKIPPDVGRRLLNLKDDRENVDYELFTDATEAEATEAVREADALVSAAWAYLRQAGAVE